MAPALDVYLKWPARKKAMVWAAFCVVVGIAYYFLGFMPRLEELRQLDEKYAQLGKEQRENQAIADNLALVKEEVRRLDQKLASALEKLPNKEEIPNLLRTVSDLGKESGLEFLLFKPAPPVPKDFYAEVPLELQVLGRFHDIAQFFDKIGRLPRIVMIQDLDLGSAKPAPGGVKLTASCKATTFKFLDPAEKAAVDKAKADAAKKANPNKEGAT